MAWICRADEWKYKCKQNFGQKVFEKSPKSEAEKQKQRSIKMDRWEII